MSSQSPIILLEFNELTPRLMDQFIAAGKLPNFKRLRDESLVWITDAEDKQEYLEPWIQWVTVHTGLRFEDHGVFRLSDAAKMTAESIWTTLARHSLPVWICGSMNVNYAAPIGGFVLPDPWSMGFDPYPEELRPFYRFVQVNVQEHTNPNLPLGPLDYLKFLWFMLTHGLSIGTSVAAVSQLVKERLQGEGRWKRAVILDKLQWDLFESVYKRISPAFATFFLNSTAHLQHVYWRNLEPDSFEIRPTDEDQERYRDAILFGYQEMDKLIGRALNLDPNATIFFCTALGQQPYLLAESAGGKWFHRPKDFDLFVREFALKGIAKVVPVMSEHFRLHFENEEFATAAESSLGSVTLNGQPFLEVTRTGSEIFTGCKIHEQIAPDAELVFAGGRRIKAGDVFYMPEGVLKSGMHHPDGMLWVRTPSKSHKVFREKQPLRTIAPTILRQFGIEKAAYMADPLDFGQSS